MSLGKACDLLEVNESTLRQWADNGLIRAYRTPGGHRRFSSEAVHALIGRQLASLKESREPVWTDKTLQRVRRRLQSSQTLSQHWRQVMDDASRSRMRLLGRRLLTIAADYATQPRLRADLVEEARLIGEEHGAEMVKRSIPLKDALEAFVFFRGFLLETAPASGSGTPGEQMQMWRSINLLADQVLVSMASCYDTSPAPAPSATPDERSQ
ncbi:MAG: hypothetical protein HW388_1340 [Dehalococcoidia bacterium]|nr:hypothetical protein [Dehalococcoidia bacterium]